MRKTVVSGFAMVNGLKMYYEIHGKGAPLVLIHGGGSYNPNLIWTSASFLCKRKTSYRSLNCRDMDTPLI